MMSTNIDKHTPPPEHTARMAGRIAKGEDENPYPEDSYLHQHWRLGWQEKHLRYAVAFFARNFHQTEGNWPLIELVASALRVDLQEVVAVCNLYVPKIMDLNCDQEKRSGPSIVAPDFSVVELRWL